jgi:hypothetical protein
MFLSSSLAWGLNFYWVCLHSPELNLYFSSKRKKVPMKFFALVLSVLLPWAAAEAHSIKALRCAFLHASDTGTPYRGNQIHNLSVHQNSDGLFIEETTFGRGTHTYELREVKNSPQSNGSVNTAYVTEGLYTASITSVDGVPKAGVLTLKGRYNSFCRSTGYVMPPEAPVPAAE